MLSPPSVTIDLPTLFISAVFSDLVLGLLFLFVVGRRSAGLLWWGGALLLRAFAVVLLALRGRVHDVISVDVGNSLLALSFALLIVAFATFLKKARPTRWLVAMVASAVVCTIVSPDFHARVATLGAIYVAYCAASAAWLWTLRDGVRPRLIGILCGLYAVGAIGFGFRVIGAMFFPAQISESGPHSFMQVVSTFAGPAFIIGSSFIFVLMYKERAEVELAQKAAVDSLTGAFNRRYFEDLANRQVHRCRREQVPLSLILFDVDEFKDVNDTHGHAAGDKVLRIYAALVHDSIRTEDIFARYGGDEFCLLLPGQDEESAALVGERIRIAVENTTVELGAKAIPFSVSVGVATAYVPSTVEDLMHVADEALYDAKRGGRNRVARRSTNVVIDKSAEETSASG